MVFALNDKNSFEEMKQLRQSIVNLRNTSKIPMVIAGNKCDLPNEQREIQNATAKAWCDSVKLPYLETSAKVCVIVRFPCHLNIYDDIGKSQCG